MKWHLGAEIEYWCEEEPDIYHIREYYEHQYESNDFHVRCEEWEHTLPQLFKWADRLRSTSRAQEYEMTKALNTSHGLVFSGVHLHLQVKGGIADGVAHVIKRQMAARLSRIVEADILKYYGLSARNLVSHHIHGRSRGSSRDFKARDRFKPVIYHQRFDTFELRCIEPEMLYTYAGKVALKSILKRAYAYLEGKRVPVEGKYSDMVGELRKLPGDMDTSEQVGEYIDFLQRVKEQGVNTTCSFNTADTAFILSYAGMVLYGGEVHVVHHRMVRSIVDRFVRFASRVRERTASRVHTTGIPTGGRSVISNNTGAASWTRLSAVIGGIDE